MKENLQFAPVDPPGHVSGWQFFCCRGPTTWPL